MTVSDRYREERDHYRDKYMEATVEIEQLKFELNVAKEREAIDNTESKLANERIERFQPVLRSIRSWAQSGIDLTHASATNDLFQYIRNACDDSLLTKNHDLTCEAHGMVFPCEYCELLKGKLSDKISNGV